MTLIRRIIFLLALVLSVGHGQYSIAADGLSFNPTLITITSTGTIPVGTVIPWPSTSFPPDASRWLECNGQAVPSGSQYDRLRAAVGTNVPNYGDQFLRGTTTLSLVGTKVSDSIRSHTVYVPGQNAPVSGNLNSTGLSGSASPQSYSYQAVTGSQTVLTWVDGVPNLGQTQSPNMGWSNGSTSGGSVSGSLNSGSLTGTAYVSSQTGTYAGGSETAPVHTRVRYLIRAVP
ncbi:phage tail protein [Solidesulfovibrio carbinolicus]|uniref:Phage tail protein n=1 Tax=Solidesulfovibrio carbinolicus TaxID=296842 RepID=A0A4V0YQF6_9BACT|nr:phage tail protein [Solidesulfovibrio carbinolicus]QAZ66132.1 phage tail protein [Solidesulfovibrio carbinolicus]